MKATESMSFRRVAALGPGTVLRLALLFLIAAATIAAAQTTVFVPGNASGCFGSPVDGMRAIGCRY